MARNKNLQKNTRSSIIKQGKYLYSGIAALIAVAIVLNSFKFLSPNFSSGFLADKESIFFFYKYALYLHMFSAPIIVLLGIFQLLFPTNSNHKTIGKIYTLGVLFLAAPSGFIMSFYAIGGLFGTILFVCLSALWFLYTFLSFKYAINGNTLKHKHFANGSLILTNSAILLRLLYMLQIQLDIFNTDHRYIIAAFLSWVPILVGYEICAKLKRRE